MVVAAADACAQAAALRHHRAAVDGDRAPRTVVAAADARAVGARAGCGDVSAVDGCRTPCALRSAADACGAVGAIRSDLSAVDGDRAALVFVVAADARSVLSTRRRQRARVVAGGAVDGERPPSRDFKTRAVVAREECVVPRQEERDAGVGLQREGAPAVAAGRLEHQVRNRHVARHAFLDDDAHLARLVGAGNRERARVRERDVGQVVFPAFAARSGGVEGDPVDRHPGRGGGCDGDRAERHQRGEECVSHVSCLMSHVFSLSFIVLKSAGKHGVHLWQKAR